MDQQAKHRAGQSARSNPRDCGHHSLVKVEAAGVNDVDTDVLVYVCAECGKSFTASDA